MRRMHMVQERPNSQLKILKGLDRIRTDTSKHGSLKFTVFNTLKY